MKWAAGSKKYFVPSTLDDLVKTGFEQIWVKGDYTFAEQLFSEDCVHHFYRSLQAAPIPGPCGYVWIVESFHRAFSDVKLSYGWNPVGEIVHWSLIGYHREPLFGVPATNTRVKLSGNELYRYGGGRIRETWLFGNARDFWKDSPNLHLAANE